MDRLGSACSDGDTMKTPFAELIENTSGLSQGVPLGEELLASIAISLKRIADNLAQSSQVRRMVPLDPTQEMMEAGLAQLGADDARQIAFLVDDIWRAMTRAAP